MVRVRVLDRHTRAGGRMRLELRLRNGTAIVVDSALPGFGEFVAVAEQRLHGMQPLSTWLPAVATAGTTGSELVLFERTP